MLNSPEILMACTRGSNKRRNGKQALRSKGITFFFTKQRSNNPRDSQDLICYTVFYIGCPADILMPFSTLPTVRTDMHLNPWAGYRFGNIILWNIPLFYEQSDMIYIGSFSMYEFPRGSKSQRWIGHREQGSRNKRVIPF